MIFQKVANALKEIKYNNGKENNQNVPTFDNLFEEVRSELMADGRRVTVLVKSI